MGTVEECIGDFRIVSGVGSVINFANALVERAVCSCIAKTDVEALCVPISVLNTTREAN
jgi:hypothetical protein